ncbi:hypothetical protein FIM04_04255 [SAR202 cluster bacterium AC-409-J13_OGT_754m]|jgi:hypothetical protein|nr:hypothetical protein [SAR202 cluster bacterium AC-409-J13_OGT_754m]
MGAFNSNDLFSMIKASYGMRLSDDELEEVRDGVKRITELTDALRSVQLENRDEPMYWFKPYTRKELE